MKPLDIGNFQILHNNDKETRNIAKEIFRDQSYFVESIKDPKIIIDGGAHIGLATFWFRQKYPDAKIIAIEPNQGNFALLKQNVELNNLENVDILNMALAGEDGTRKLYFEDDTTTDTSLQLPYNSISSFFEGGWRGDRKQKVDVVETVRLAKIIRVLNQDIDILKLDIEGAEFEVLKDISPVVSKVKNIICEFHPVKGRKLSDITDLFKKYGFQITITEDLDRKAAKQDDKLAVIVGTR